MKPPAFAGERVSVKLIRFLARNRPKPDSCHKFKEAYHKGISEYWNDSYHLLPIDLHLFHQLIICSHFLRFCSIVGGYIGPVYYFCGSNELFI